MKTTRYQTIRKVLVALPIYLLTFLPFYFFTFMPLSLSAQDYTQRLQQSGTGQGTVTIHQSADIDYLVNNATLAPRPAPTAKGNNGQPSQPNQPSHRPTRGRARRAAKREARIGTQRGCASAGRAGIDGGCQPPPISPRRRGTPSLERGGGGD